MKPVYSFLLLAFLFLVTVAFAQESLPRINVTSFNGKVVVSWLNDYEKPVADIFIQRSYDSSRNFSTIGSVLIPQNKENGYPDNHPPYDHMYYRVSIVFEGGAYVVGPAFKSAREFNGLVINDITDTMQKATVGRIIGLSMNSLDDKNVTEIKPTLKPEPNIEKPIDPELILRNTSSLVFFNRFNQLNISIPRKEMHTYDMKVYDEGDKLVFELKKIPDENFVLEKYNFRKSGNYSFEIYEDGKLWRKNKFFIAKDPKK
jgi:hypothetical protein